MALPVAETCSWCGHPVHAGDCHREIQVGAGKRGAPHRPPVRPDLDKLARAVGDALTGVCYRDDAQVVNLCAAKYYVMPSGRLSAPGVEIRLHGEGRW